MKPAIRRQATTEAAESLCIRVAESQCGLIHRHQALAAGMSGSAIDRRVQSKRWALVFPSVYRIRGHASSPQQTAMAACMWGGDGTYCSDRTAGGLWKLEGVAPGDRINVICQRRLRNRHVIVHRRKDLCRRRDLTRLGPIPITTVTRTLIDLAATAEFRELESALDHALRDRLTSVNRLQRRLGELSISGRGGAVVLRKLLAERSIYERPPHSKFERRFLSLVRTARLPKPRPQFVVTDGPDFVGQVDFAYPALRIAIEMDSYGYHEDPLAFQVDRTQASRMAAMGWLVLFFTYDDVTRRPDDVIAALARAIDERMPRLLA